MLSFSVVIPLYNKGQYIRATIESVLVQTHRQFEVIVVDDGSSDDGSSIVAAIDDPRVRLIRQPNGGVSRARNRGIDAATGDIVTFLDADDWYGPYYLETVAKLAGEHPEIAFFGCAYRRALDFVPGDLAEPPPQPLPVELQPNYYEVLCQHRTGVHTNSVAIRRPQLVAMQPCFPEGEAHGEDQDLWFRLSEKHVLLYCSVPLVGYRIDVPGSLMTNRPAGMLPYFERLQQRALSGQLQGAQRRSALRLVAHSHSTLARAYLESGDRREAVRQVFLGWRACSQHWLISLLMVAGCSPQMASRFRKWRGARP